MEENSVDKITAGDTFGRTIQLFLVDSKPNGMRIATIHGWTGLTFVGGDAVFSNLTAREEVDRTGIYILAGMDPERLGGTRVYIGSANSVSDRIKQSAEKRDFWETAIAVTTSDDAFSKGHVEYLEARLIELANNAGRVTLDNGTQPQTGRRRLPEADRANMEQFLSNLKIILPVIGLDMLKPQPRAISQTASTAVDLNSPWAVIFEIRHKSGVQAKAVEEDGEFVVLEGSEALHNTGFIQQSYGGLKQKLLDDGVLVHNGADNLSFTSSYSFSSPSADAAVVLDRNSNGRIEWKVQDSKQTYHDWQESNVVTGN